MFTKRGPKLDVFLFGWLIDVIEWSPGKVVSIGALFGCYGRKNRWPWFTWWFNHLPGPSICPKRTPMVVSLWSFRAPVPRVRAELWNPPLLRRAVHRLYAKHGNSTVSGSLGDRGGLNKLAHTGMMHP